MFQVILNETIVLRSNLVDNYWNETLFRNVVMIFFMSIVSLNAIFGNLVVLIAFAREKNLRTVSNLFIISLSISDLLIGLFVMPMSGVFIVKNEWLFGKVTCRLWLTIDYIASTASIFNLFTLSIERCCSITYPLKFLKHKTKKKANTVILLVWFVSCLWVLPINFWHILGETTTIDVGNENNQNESYYSVNSNAQQESVEKCSTDFETHKLFKIITTSFNFYLPLFGMVLIYTRIFLTIAKRTEIELGGSYATSISAQQTTNPANKYSNDHESLYRSMIEINQDNVDYKQKSSLPLRRCSSSITINRGKYYVKALLRPDGRKNANGVCGGSPATISSQHSNSDPIFYRRNGITHLITSRNQQQQQSNASNLNFKLSNGYFKRKMMNVQSIRLKQQIKAAKQLGILLLAFLVTWLPYSIVFIVVAFCPECVPDWVNLLSVWLGYLNSSINPILYPLCNSRFREAFKKMFNLKRSPYTKYDIVKIINYSHDP